MLVSVIGMGYVGLVTAACLADLGHDVVGVEAHEKRLGSLLDGVVPFHEPGLDELVGEGCRSGRLRFSSPSVEAVSLAQAVFVAVGTHDGNGGWQSDTIQRTLSEIGPHLADDGVLIIRSTVMPDFVDRLDQMVGEIRRRAGRPPIPVVLNPEFTREGSAVHDFMEPDRVVFGVIADPTGHGLSVLQRVYRATEAPILTLSGIDAALAKLSSNLFLATKISFANELARLCEAFGGTVEEVVGAMALDHRIGGAFLRAGVGFGGSCLPHQVTMTVRTGREAGISLPLFAAVDEINHRQRVLLVERVEGMVGGLEGRRVGLLGLTFKPHTDDLRDAPSLEIARLLIQRGARVAAYDPMPGARARAALEVPGLEPADSVAEALQSADAAALITEWPEFSEIDWATVRGLMRGDVVVDGRNALDPAAVARGGYRYSGIGRGAHLRASLRPVAATSAPDDGIWASGAVRAASAAAAD